MELRLIITIVALLILLPGYLEAQTSPMEHLENFMRVRGDSSGEEVVYHWTGTVYSFVPGQRKRELFAFEGFNIAKTIPAENGFQLLTREAAFFLDPQSGEILSTWRNPFTDATVDVVQIWNDPVNQDLTFDQEYLPYISRILPVEDLGDQLAYYMDIFPFYDSPLTRRDYGDFSQSDTYQAAEFFQFFVDKSDLANEELTTVPTTISWTRISPWMPFMRMGDRPGNLVFVCRGRKLDGGFEALPAKIKDYVMANGPQFSEAPMEFLSPNETSWTYFKKLVDGGQIQK